MQYCAHHAVLGIGFGPANLAVAIAAAELAGPIDLHFLEARSGPAWQPGMLLDGSDIQNNPLRDLVTLRNPRSKFSFINYLNEAGRLLDFLNLGVPYPLRKDYAKYISWAASHFDQQVSYGANATCVAPHASGEFWQVWSSAGLFTADTLIVAPGRPRNIPDVFASSLGPRIFHSNDYVHRLNTLQDAKSIAVIGASQSAVEIILDLRQRRPSPAIHAVHRSFSFRQKDTSPFSDHVYFPEFTDQFYDAPACVRADLQRQLRATNYSAVDQDILHRLYLQLYEDRLDGGEHVFLHPNCAVRVVESNGTSVRLGVQDTLAGTTRTLDVDAVVLATGFRDIGAGINEQRLPALLEGASDVFEQDEAGGLRISRDYQVATCIKAPLYLNGLCESTHGFGDAGSFSLLSLRAWDIIGSIADIPPRRDGKPVNRVVNATSR